MSGKRQSYVYLVTSGSYYTDGVVDCVFKKKKDAVKYCREDGFKYVKSDGLFCGKKWGHRYWRSIEPIELH